MSRKREAMQGIEDASYLAETLQGCAMAEQMNMSMRAWAEMLLLSVIWGGSFLSIHVALDEIGVATPPWRTGSAGPL